ncbi:hypothetical protein Hrd1104_07505 [Halorhabdus sp. CBA1104]|nr:hypothetical protein Hrd1104_07505 [Halorhabdus sp. CBA1104]
MESRVPTCEASGCAQSLDAAHRRPVYESLGGTRHVSACGTVTITVYRSSRPASLNPVARDAGV